MKIDNLHLHDFRGIHELNLELGGRSTILFGINGVGKSTILSSINLLYASIINRVVKQRFKQTINMELSDIKAGKSNSEIGAEFMFEDGAERFPFHRRMQYDNKRLVNNTELEKLIEYYGIKYIGKIGTDEHNNLHWENPDFNLPIFVNYGVNRLVLKTPLRIRKGPFYRQYSAFENAIENQIAFGKLFEWFLEQELDESLKKKEKPSYRDKDLKAVKKAMLAMLDGYQDIHIVAKPYSMKVKKNGETLDILQLSDGEKCTLALFGDIARRLAIANPSLKNPLEGTGVVLIDELELHMHTSWQRKIVGVLAKTFPNIQFIVTTHSPQILGEINGDYNIIALSNAKNGVNINHMDSLYGLDSNAILEDIMKTDSINGIIKNKVSQMYDAIENKDYSEAENLINEIDGLTLGRNVDTVRANTLIQRRKMRNA